MNYLVTGGSGFLGSIMCSYLSELGHKVISLDILPADKQPCFRHLQIDLADSKELISALKSFDQIDCIFHVGAVLAHVKEHRHRLWQSNVFGTRNIMDCARQLSIPKVIFTSSYCVYSRGSKDPINETTPTRPIEPYGWSKLEGEKIVESYPDIQGVSIRCPSIIEAGRLGLLTILFDFVREGRRLYLVKGGKNRYSFIAARDLCNAMLMAANSQCRGLYHIGSDNVPTMRQVYEDLVRHAGKEPKIVVIPEIPTIAAFSILNLFGCSPLSPYHYKMLSANMVADNSKLKKDLGWAPTRTNSEIMCEAYDYYIKHLEEIIQPGNKSAHKQRANMGVLYLLKMIS